MRAVRLSSMAIAIAVVFIATACSGSTSDSSAQSSENQGYVDVSCNPTSVVLLKRSVCEAAERCYSVAQTKRAYLASGGTISKQSSSRLPGHRSTQFDDRRHRVTVSVRIGDPLCDSGGYALLGPDLRALVEGNVVVVFFVGARHRAFVDGFLRRLRATRRTS